MTIIASVFSSAAAAKSAFSVLTALQLTAYMWPPSATLPNGTSFDFIIPGGGAAGSILANRLTESGQFKVLLIEAGGDPKLEAETPSTFPYILKTDADWQYYYQADGNTAKLHSTNGMYAPSGKMLGGSGSIFLHLHVRADPSFYDTWAKEVNDPSWSYDSTLPYFIKSETVLDEKIMSSKYASYHGTKGPMGLSRFLYNETQNYLNAFSELGNQIILDKNADIGVGYFEPLWESTYTKFQGPGQAYLSSASDRPNLYVLKNTLATKILFDENKTAIAVEVIDKNNDTLIFNAKKEIIVSTGAIKTPQLLMLSGIGPKEHLKSFGINVVADLPVGESYKDLYGVLLGHKMQQANATPTTTSPYAAGPVFVGYSALNKSQTAIADYATENFILSGGSTTSAVYCSFYFGFNNDVCEKYLQIQATNEVLLTFLLPLDAKSQGKIQLFSTNPRDAPVIYSGFFDNEEDIDNTVKFIQDYTSVRNSAYFKSVGGEFIKPDIAECAELEDYSAEYWKCYIPRMVISIYKYMASCPMGKVVDTSLKVMGVNNLRVVDASVFPKATRAQSMATVTMVAEKGAAMILNDYVSCKSSSSSSSSPSSSSLLNVEIKIL